MGCTTILVGKGASYDGSTIVARNDDDQNGTFTEKRFAVVTPSEQPRTYRSCISRVTIELPDHPLAYTCLPNAVPEREGIWAVGGINAANVGMSATETISCNERVLAADPTVHHRPAKGRPGEAGYEPAVESGIGEEDIVTICLPYIRSAREGVLLLGSYLERYGTYETNGIAFHDQDEIWWFESIGGHHWIARRVPDDCYVVMPNQLGIDRFDLDDALGDGKDFLCSADLADFMATYHLDLTMRGPSGIGYSGERPHVFNPRLAFGTATDTDHVYNTPRAWVAQRHLNPHAAAWDGTGADLTPTADDIPWCRIPEHKLTIEDVKRVLSDHYVGTPYDPYGPAAATGVHPRYRPIGINRTATISATQISDDASDEYAAVHWFSFASNVYNALVPQFAHVGQVPAYFGGTTDKISCEHLYWQLRLVSALADPIYQQVIADVERYQIMVDACCTRVILEAARNRTSREEANDEIARIVRGLTDNLLATILYASSMSMANAFSRSDH